MARIENLYHQVLKIFNSRKKLIKPLIILKIHADWCDESKMIAPKYTSLKNKFEGNSVLFLEFDLSNPSTKEQACQLANTLNIHSSLVETDKKTGQILLVDGKNSAVLDKLHKNMLFSEMVKSVQKYLN